MRFVICIVNTSSYKCKILQMGGMYKIENYIKKKCFGTEMICNELLYQKKSIEIFEK